MSMSWSGDKTLGNHVKLLLIFTLSERDVAKSIWWDVDVKKNGLFDSEVLGIDSQHSWFEPLESTLDDE